MFRQEKWKPAKANWIKTKSKGKTSPIRTARKVEFPPSGLFSVKKKLSNMGNGAKIHLYVQKIPLERKNAGGTS